MKNCRGFLIATLIIVALAVLLMWMANPAHSHGWYSRTNCCSGNDCAEVPLDVDWVTIEKNGYRVFLTAEQAKLVNPYATYPINELVPWHSNKIKMPPALRAGETYGKALYHICISATGTLYCLFPVPLA